MESAQISLVVRHRLEGRLRLFFSEPLTASRRRQINWAFEHNNPLLKLRWCDLGQGLVVVSSEGDFTTEHIVDLLDLALNSAPVQLVSKPPTALEQFGDQARHGSIKVLLALAIAGFVLPVLPGTPFFLAAWWLGWRPAPSTLDPGSSVVVDEFQNQMPALLPGSRTSQIP